MIWHQLKSKGSIPGLRNPGLRDKRQHTCEDPQLGSKLRQQRWVEVIGTEKSTELCVYCIPCVHMVPVAFFPPRNRFRRLVWVYIKHLQGSRLEIPRCKWCLKNLGDWKSNLSLKLSAAKMLTHVVHLEGEYYTDLKTDFCKWSNST